MKNKESYTKEECLEILEKIRTEPIATTSFPSHFSVALRIRDMVNDTRFRFNTVTDVIKAEPIVASKVLQTANAASRYSGHPVTSLTEAVQKLGVDQIKRIVLAVTMMQLSKSKKMLNFSAKSRMTWLNSLYTGAASYVLSERKTTYTPNDTFYQAIVINIGIFYFLYEFSNYGKISIYEDELRAFVKKHYLDKSLEILSLFDIPLDNFKDIISKIKNELLPDKDMLTMSEVVYQGYLHSRNRYNWLEENELTIPDYNPYDLLYDIDTRFKAMRLELAG